jgi:hypothetical protein
MNYDSTVYSALKNLNKIIFFNISKKVQISGLIRVLLTVMQETWRSVFPLYWSGRRELSTVGVRGKIISHWGGMGDI